MGILGGSPFTGGDGWGLILGKHGALWICLRPTTDGRSPWAPPPGGFLGIPDIARSSSGRGTASGCSWVWEHANGEPSEEDWICRFCSGVGSGSSDQSPVKVVIEYTVVVPEEAS